MMDISASKLFDCEEEKPLSTAKLASVLVLNVKVAAGAEIFDVASVEKHIEPQDAIREWANAKSAGAKSTVLSSALS